MRVVCCVPMKLYNERLPNKNIIQLANGQPLCTFILQTLLGISVIDDIIVYCSDSSITSYLPVGVRFMKRGTHLDTNTTSMIEVLQCFVSDVEADIYILAHATAPFLQSSSIENALQQVKSGCYDSAFSVQKHHDFIWINGIANYDPKDIPRTQDLPPYFKETSGFYIFKRSVITQLGQRIGSRPYMQEVNWIEGIDIDDQEDLNFANTVLLSHMIKETEL